MKQSFTKEERLHSRKLIDELFKKGNSFFQYPFKVITAEIEAPKPLPPQLLISVPKRNYKKAVDRNKIKRLVKEAYRKNNNAFFHSRNKTDSQLLVGLIYNGKTIMSYAEIERKIILILQRLIEQDEQAAG